MVFLLRNSIQPELTFYTGISACFNFVKMTTTATSFPFCRFLLLRIIKSIYARVSMFFVARFSILFSFKAKKLNKNIYILGF